MTFDEHLRIEERLSELRRSKGLSQEQLADLLGVSRQAVSKWESGQALPEVEKLIALSRLYETSIDYILTGETLSSPPLSDAAAAEVAPDPRARSRGDAKVGSLVTSAVALMLFAIALFATFGQLSDGTSTMDIYVGLVIVSVGVMILLVGLIIAGGRIHSRALFVANILLAAVLPAMLVAKLVPGSGSSPWPTTISGTLAAAVAYVIICGIALYFGIIRKRKAS